MKLEPIAKPIRIRVISGGEEHSSLESLRKNFSLYDLVPIVNNGTLVKWLRQKGKKELADKVATFHFQSGPNNPDKNEVIAFINIFFPETQELSLDDLISSWYNNLDYKRNYQYLVNYLRYFPSIYLALAAFQKIPDKLSKKEWRALFITKLNEIPLEDAVTIYVNKSLTAIINDDDWTDIFCNRQNISDPNSLFRIGEKLESLPDHKEAAMIFYRQSADLGHLEAKNKLRIPEVEYINYFLDDLAKFQKNIKPEDKNKDIVHFLNNMAEAYRRNCIIDKDMKRLGGVYAKYYDIINILWKRRYKINSIETSRHLTDLEKKYYHFPALKKVISDVWNNTFIIEVGTGFIYLDYQRYVKYVVGLVKDYEF